MAAISGNLRKLRKRKALTQKDLADLAGCARSYVTAIETGACGGSIAVLEKLAKALEVSVADLVAPMDSKGSGLPEMPKVSILNNPSSGNLASPKSVGATQATTADVFLVSRLRARDSFGVYLADDSMAPEFGRGDLVVFSRSRKPKDGDACLVDKGKGQVLFRTVWALPGGGWGLKASSPRYEPTVAKGKRVRIWPAVGHWRMLASKRKR